MMRAGQKCHHARVFDEVVDILDDARLRIETVGRVYIYNYLV